MSPLIDYQIKQLCEENGLVEPYEPELINPSSLDIRLGHSILEDVANGWFDNSEYFNTCTKENPYLLPPYGLILAATLETFKLPPNIACELKLKSSRAREKLNHALAGWIDNGFHGVITLELKNYSQFQDIKLYPGLRLAQLVIYRTMHPENTYKNGRYAGHSRVMSSLDV